MKNRYLGRLIVISAVSGAGKTTVCDVLAKRFKTFVRSVSVTTRVRHRGEKDGVDYFFVTEKRFEEMKRKKMFLEYQRVHSYYYGTPKRFVLDNLRKGKNVVLVIDTKGGLNIKKMFGDAILIFILPPSLDELIRRLHLRGRESEEERMKRINIGKGEIRDAYRYDYVIVNEDVEQTASDIAAIVRASELRKEFNKDKIDRILEEYNL